MAGSGQGLGARIRQLVAAKVADALRESPEQYARLVSLGLVDPGAVDRLPEDGDLAGAIRTFIDRAADLAREKPSVLAELDVRPLQVFSVGEEAPMSLPRAAARSERTVVFSDLEGFTAFNRTRGDVEASAMLADHYEVVEAIVRPRGGRVVKTLGDGHMLGFTEPSAAVMACIELVEHAPRPLRLRAGTHRGDVVVRDRDLLGDVVNVAARVTDLAGGGIALASWAVRSSLPSLPGVSFGDPESHVVPGIDVPIVVSPILRT